MMIQQNQAVNIIHQAEIISTEHKQRDLPVIAFISDSQMPIIVTYLISLICLIQRIKV